MRETIKDYLTFSKKERTGILVLIAVVIVTAVAPAFYRSEIMTDHDSTMLIQFKEQITLLDAADNQRRADSMSSPGRNGYNHGQKSVDDLQYPVRQDYQDNRQYSDNRYDDGNKVRQMQKVVMFDFDPNTITTAGWVQLGVSERTATTIDKYRSKGGSFRKADDILRIYGLSEEDKKRLLPFVKIPAGETSNRRFSTDDYQAASAKYAPGDFKLYARKIPQIIDINTADTSAWRSLPGIGPVLSQRIIKYRDRLGGFYSIEQVAEVYGLQDSVYQKILPFLSRVAAVHKINVNAATPDVLGQHPYLKPQLARAIVDYRSQHGIFKEIAELKQVISISPELFDRISHYIGL
jgi:competence protein ComEA